MGYVPLPLGTCEGPAPENLEKLHAFWCNLTYYRPHFLCPDICYFLLPSMALCENVSWKDSLITEGPDTRNGRTCERTSSIQPMNTVAVAHCPSTSSAVTATVCGVITAAAAAATVTEQHVSPQYCWHNFHIICYILFVLLFYPFCLFSENN